MDTNKLLRENGYAGHKQFGEIAKFSHGLAKDGVGEGDIVTRLNSVYPLTRKLKPFDKPRPYSIFGRVQQYLGQSQHEYDIDFGSVKQMEKAMSIPPAVAGAIMPDAHLGYALNIGGVAALHNAVSPSFVGYDIGCRMTLTILDEKPDVLTNPQEWLETMKAVSHFGADSPPWQRQHQVMENSLWNELPVLKSLKQKAQQQLGTSGSGNHLFNVMSITVTKERDWLGLPIGEQRLALMTHSGSRGTGHKLATHYVKLAQQETCAIASGIENGYEWLDMDSEAGQEYWACMWLMNDYAKANHECIHNEFLKATGIKQFKRFENAHNLAWVENDLVVHRKGATPAHKGKIGIIPGSCNTKAYLVEGKGNKDSLCSSSHGAGRVASRTAIKKLYTESESYRARVALAREGVLLDGVNVDESPLAYKDINRVMEQQKDLVEPIATMQPEISLMGGLLKSDDGD